MIWVVQDKLIKLLKETFNKYDIDIQFKYDQQMNLSKSFRNNFTYLNNFTNKLLQKQKAKNFFCIFSRSALQKSSERFSNQKIEIGTFNSDDNYNLRGIIAGDIDFSFNIIINDYQDADNFELLYNFEFVNSPKTFNIKLKFEEDTEEIELSYNIKFNQLSSLELLDESTLRVYNFECGLSGVFIIPYMENYKSIKYIDISTYIEDLEGNNISKIDEKIYETYKLNTKD